MFRYTNTSFKTSTTQIILVLLMACCSFSLPAQNKKQVLEIAVTGLRNDNGKVLISVYNSADGFPGKAEKAVYKGEASVHNNVAHFLYQGIQAGNYAIAVLHDENANNKMDTRFPGLPKEGYGFSKNVMGLFGPPSFAKASFAFPATSSVTIKMKYY